LRKNACCRVIVTENFDMPAKHEANVPVKLLGSDHLFPQTDCTIEPCELQKGVVAARTLVSRDLKGTVARVCNYSNEPIEFKANTLLGLAEPAEYMQGTSQETVKPSLESCNDSANVAVQKSEETELRVPKRGSRAKPGAVNPCFDCLGDAFGPSCHAYCFCPRRKSVRSHSVPNQWFAP